MLSLHTERLSAETPSGKPPLIIAHGLFGQGKNFRTLARVFSSQRDVVLVDMRNHGKSPWHDVMSYSAMAADLARLIDDIPGPKASILGHSMGGKAVMALALTRPELLSCAIIADIAPVKYTHSYSSLIESLLAIDMTAINSRREMSAALEPRITDLSMRAFLLQNLEFNDGSARWLPNLEVLLQTLPNILGWPETLDAPTATPIPVLGLRGTKSDYMAGERETAFMHMFPAAKMQSLENAGHWLHAEAREPFADAVQTFLTGEGL